MIQKIKPSKSEKVIFIFIIVLALFSFGSFEALLYLSSNDLTH